MSGVLADGVKGKLQGSLDRRWEWDSVTDVELGASPDVALNSQGHADAYLQLTVESGTADWGLVGTDRVDANNVPTEFEPVKGADGTALSVSADGIYQLQNLPKFFKPSASTTGTAHIVVVGRLS